MSTKQQNQWKANFRKKYGKTPYHNLEALLRELDKEDGDSFRLGKFTQEEARFALQEIMQDLIDWKAMTKQLNRMRGGSYMGLEEENRKLRSALRGLMEDKRLNKITAKDEIRPN